MIVFCTWLPSATDIALVNTSRPRQNGHGFVDHIFKWVSVNENAVFLLQMSLKFVPKVPIINNNLALVYAMAWYQIMSVAIMISSTDVLNTTVDAFHSLKCALFGYQPFTLCIHECYVTTNMPPNYRFVSISPTTVPSLVFFSLPLNFYNFLHSWNNLLLLMKAAGTYVGNVVQGVFAVVVCLLIGMSLSWKLSIVLCLFVPPLLVSSFADLMIGASTANRCRLSNEEGGKVCLPIPLNQYYQICQLTTTTRYHHQSKRSGERILFP